MVFPVALVGDEAVHVLLAQHGYTGAQALPAVRAHWAVVPGWSPRSLPMTVGGSSRARLSSTLLRSALGLTPSTRHGHLAAALAS